MERFDFTKKASIYGILCNIFLFIIKIFIGIYSRSQSMIADAVNSASDVFASFLTYIGNKISSEPKDDSHNFGHGKAEYIFSLFISISMIISVLKLLQSAITSLILHKKIEFNYFLILVCFITIFVKICLYIYTNKISKKFNNILLESNKADHRNDCIVTSFTLISIILSTLGIYWFDSVVSIGISFWIAYTAIQIFIESFNILMDSSIDDLTKETILNIVKSFSEIKSIVNFYSAPVGYQYFVVLTISVDGNLSTFNSHSIADELEKQIRSLDKIYDVVIHIEPK